MSKAIPIINGDRKKDAQDLHKCVAFEAITADLTKFRFEPVGVRAFDAAVFIPTSHTAQEYYFTDEVKNQYAVKVGQLSDTVGHGGVAGANYYLFEFHGDHAPIYLEDLANLSTLNHYFKAHAGVPGRDITRFDTVSGNAVLAHGQFTLTYIREGNVNGRPTIVKVPVEAGLTPLLKPVRKYLYIYKRQNGALVFLTSNNKENFPSSVALMYKGAFAPADTGLVFAAEVGADLSLIPVVVTVALNGVSYTYNNTIQRRPNPSALITGVQPSSPRSAAGPTKGSGVISAPLSPRSAAAAAAGPTKGSGVISAPLSPRSAAAAAAAGTGGFGTTAPQSSSTSTGFVSPRSAAAAGSTSTGLLSPRSAAAAAAAGTGGFGTTAPQTSSKSSGVISAPHSPRTPVTPVTKGAFSAPAQTSSKSSGVISAPLSPRTPVAPVTQSSPTTISTPPQSASMLNPSSPVRQPAQSATVVNIPVPSSVTKVGTFIAQPNGTQTMTFTQQPPASASGFGTAGSSFGDVSSAFRQLPKGI